MAGSGLGVLIDNIFEIPVRRECECLSNITHTQISHPGERTSLPIPRRRFFYTCPSRHVGALLAQTDDEAGQQGLQVPPRQQIVAEERAEGQGRGLGAGEQKDSTAAGSV